MVLLERLQPYVGRLQGIKVERLAAWGGGLLALLFAYTLAGVTWQLMPAPDRQAALLSSGLPNSAANEGSGPAARLSDVVRLHLFGNAAASARPAAVERTPSVATDAPDTRLNLTLKGVWAADDPGAGYAIIASGSRDEAPYWVGASIPGGVILHEVYGDRVILKRNGQFETLRMEKEASSSPATPARARAIPPRGSANNGNSVAVEPQRLSEYRERFIKSPNDVLKYARVQPYMVNGALKGYRLSPGADASLFNELGLQAGDVLTSVNGTEVSDPAKLGALLKQVGSASQINVTILRQGLPENMTLNFR